MSEGGKTNFPPPPWDKAKGKQEEQTAPTAMELAFGKVGVVRETPPAAEHFKPPYDFRDVNELWDATGIRPRAEDVEAYAKITDEKEREVFRKNLHIAEQERVVQEANKEADGRGRKRAFDVYSDFPREPVELSLAEPASFEPEIVPVVAEETRKEQRSKLRELVGKFTESAKEKLGMSERGEKLKDYFATRSGELSEKAKEYGPGIGGFIRLAGEKYNAMSMKKKIALGFGMGAGAAIFSGVSTPLAFLFGTGLAAQRVAGNLGMFCKIENVLKKQGVIRDDADKIERMVGTSIAALSALLYTILASEAIGGAVHIASESAPGEAVHEWLRHHYPFGEAVVPVAGTAEATGVSAPAPVIEPPASVEAPAPVAEVPRPVVAETHTATVQHEIPKVATARIVSEPVSISPEPTGSAITEGPNVRIEDDIRQRALASVAVLDQEAPTTIETPVASAPVEPAPPAPIIVEAPVATQPLEVIQTPPPIETIQASEAPTATIDTTPIQEQNFVVDSSGDALLDSEGQPVHTGAFEHAPGTNAFGIEVKADVPHVYTDAVEQHLFVFGGSPAERAKSIFDFLTQNPDKVVFAADDSGKYRIPWHMVEGKVTPGSPLRTSGFFGFFSDFMKAPEPDELAKLIK